MRQGIFTIIENSPIARNTMLMRAGNDAFEAPLPGQFVNIALDGFFLRRPISVADACEGMLTVVYKIVGDGTRKLAGLEPGAKLDILTGLGNGYDTSKAGESPLLIGGGAGVPPLYMLAKALKEQGREVTALLGFNTADEVFFEKEFEEAGCKVSVVTADGSRALKGFVTDHLPEDCSYFFTCGPKPMLRAVYEKTRISGQFSFEERMGCGFGACMGCSCKTKNGSKRVCKDGPVFEKEEILWED